MARFTPDGWHCSQLASQAYLDERVHFDDLVAISAKRFFNILGHGKQDLIQEGLIAVLYALDTFDPKRQGKCRDAYVARVVYNALAMVACATIAQSRQPRMWVQSATGKWEQVPIIEFSDPDTVQSTAGNPEMGLLEEERQLAEQRRRVAQRTRIQRLQARLTPLAARLLDVKMSPPIELLVAARNISGRRIGERSKLPNSVIAVYLGATKLEVARAAREIRDAIKVNP